MATTDTARYGDLCRLCATKTNMIAGSLNIFQREGNGRQIFKKIETCLPVQIHETDELPKMICENCLYKLELLFDFRERSIRTEMLLIDLFKELNEIELQVDQQLKISLQLDQNEMIMVPNISNSMHVTEIDIGHLTHRELGHGLILQHQNDIPPSLDDLNNHDLNQELSNHSMQMQDGILGNGEHGSYSENNLEFPGHQILTEQYTALSDISLSETLPHTRDSLDIKTDVNLNDKTNSPNNSQISTPLSNSETDQNLVINQLNNLKQEDSNSENRLLIDENKEYLNDVNSIDMVINDSDNKDWIYCSLCGKSFQHTQAFQEHYEAHFNKCTICLAAFTNQEDLNSHRKEVHGCSPEHTKPMKQRLKRTPSSTTEKDNSDSDTNLDLNFPDDDEDDEEEEEEDSTSVIGNDDENRKKRKWSPKVCTECGKSYKTNYKLNEHMRKHTGEQPFKCSSCDKAFRSKIGLAQHEAKHTGQYDFSCPTCGKGFQCKSYLMVHQRAHSDIKPYPCTTCGRNFKTKQSLLDHTNRHLGVKPYVCDVCGRSFITKGLCKAHQKIHTGADNRKYSCKVCNKMFVSKSYLQTHSRIHTGEKPFMCEVCGKGFLTRVDLKIHSTMHTGEKSYVCEMCGKAFARRDALRCHRRSHTGERPYCCDLCGQTFTQFSPMAIHKRLHTGERPYSCETCGKKFVSRSTMMVHSKKHVR